METVVLTGIGLAALGYVGYLIWRSVKGKAGCSCGGSCRSAGCHCEPEDEQK